MALRLPSRQIARISSTAHSGVRCTRNTQRHASVAAATAGSNLSEAIKEGIQRDASLPTPDPPADSGTAALVNEQTPYLVPTYVQPPPMFVKGQGCYLWDLENRRYLDFTAGIAVNSLGHCDPEMSKLIAQQAKTLIHTSNLYHTPWVGSLSQLIVSKTVEAGGMQSASKVFISNSGTEANEAAMKFARKVGKVLEPSGSKYEIVSFHQSFHGRTFGALSATPNPKYQKPFAPMLPGFKYGTFNDADPNTINDLITPQTCGVIVEPIQGEGGINVASEAFLSALGQRCNDVGAVLIYDEIQSGLSRTGQLWAHQAYPSTCQPDMLTTAKALGNGFPIGATLVNEHVASKIATGDHGTTFGGNPLACRLAHYIFSRLSESRLQAEVLHKSQIFRRHFSHLQKRYPHLITEIRGRGLILGVQLTIDPAPIIAAARERGLLIITCGEKTLRFVPPLIVSEEEIQEGMGVLEKAFEESAT